VTALLGGEIGSFLAMTVVLFGGAAFLTGQTLAQSWRPGWQILPACRGDARRDLAGSLPPHPRAEDGAAISLALRTPRTFRLARKIAPVCPG